MIFRKLWILHICAGKKIFLTVNTLLKNKEIETELFSYLKPLYEHGLDAVIVQDYGVFQFVHRNFPELALHASTQMSVSNVSGAKFLMEHGVERVVTARELSRSEIRRIYDETGVEIESFNPWCTLLLLFRSVPDEQYAWRTKRKPRTLRTALPSGLSGNR